MFTGIVTDVGTVRSAEQRGDLRLMHRHRLRPWQRRSRRLDRLLGRLPDRRRQGRGLVRGRCLGRDRVADRRRPLARRARGSTSNARSGSATSLAAISSPAMSTRSATVVVVPTRRRFAARRHRTCPRALGPMIAAKGSIALDGVSLTVNDVRDAGDGTTRFSVNIIPAYRRADDARLRSAPADSSMSKSTSSPAISTGCSPPAHSRNIAVPAFHHIVM